MGTVRPLGAARIEEFLAGLVGPGEPGLAVAVAHRGAVVYRRGFGMARVEPACPLTPSTPMRIASVTKQFAAFTYLSLCRAGRAGLDDPIGRYLPELAKPVCDLTVRQMLAHQSGLLDAAEIGQLFGGDARVCSAADVLRFYTEAGPVNFPPSSAYCYNNGGYTLVSLAIERITNLPFAIAIRNLVLGPLGLPDTALHRVGEEGPGAAIQYRREPDRAFVAAEPRVDSLGAGGLTSTADDLLRWLGAMAEGLCRRDVTWTALAVPQTLNDGSDSGYGLGLSVGTYRGLRTLSHSGSLPGCSTHALRAPEVDLDVVVLANRDDLSAGMIAHRLVDVWLPEQETIWSGRDRVTQGVFLSNEGVVLELWGANGAQQMALNGEQIPVIAERPGLLRPPPRHRDAHLAIEVVDPPGKDPWVVLLDHGRRDAFTLLRRPSEATLAPGRYRSDCGRIAASIIEGTRLDFHGFGGAASYDLQPVAAGVWRASGGAGCAWRAIVTASDADRFFFSTPRTRRYPFGRIS